MDELTEIGRRESDILFFENLDYCRALLQTARRRKTLAISNIEENSLTNNIK